jgi:hypothetical protein
MRMENLSEIEDQHVFRLPSPFLHRFRVQLNIQYLVIFALAKVQKRLVPQILAVQEVKEAC